MNKITALEFQRNLGKYQREAQRAPVEITHHGRRDLVLLSAEYFDWLNAAAKRAHDQLAQVPPVPPKAASLPQNPNQAADRIRARAAAAKLGPFNWPEWKALRDEGRR